MLFVKFSRSIALKNRRLFLISLTILCLFLQGASRGGKVSANKVNIPKDIKHAIEHINPESLKGHLSFLASDMLEGRSAGSKNADIAAEYIAAQFRRAGLEPAGDTDAAGNKSFFQLGEMENIKLKNVIGLLRGSDPNLKNTYVILSAHYDHVGIGKPVDGDSIYNGANDDASGTVSVIEIASALDMLKTKPKRSILFIAWAGEENGLFGSRYYGAHPTVPLNKTVAMLNLEQLGRTDDSEGPRVKGANMTGFDFTDMGPIFKDAGDKVGIKVEKHPRFSDTFFSRSDNQALADVGIPAHTLSVAYMFPDYHKPADQWEKIDYANMAAVDRMIALGLYNVANNPKTPKWNESNPKTAKYVKSAQNLK